MILFRFVCVSFASTESVGLFYVSFGRYLLPERLRSVSRASPVHLPVRLSGWVSPTDSLRLILSAASRLSTFHKHRTIANQSAARASVCHGTIAVVKVSPWNLVRRLFNTDLVAKQFIIKCTLINEFILTNLSHFHLPSTDSDRRNAANEMLFAV